MRSYQANLQSACSVPPADDPPEKVHAALFISRRDVIPTVTWFRPLAGRGTQAGSTRNDHLYSSHRAIKLRRRTVSPTLITTPKLQPSAEPLNGELSAARLAAFAKTFSANSRCACGCVDAGRCLTPELGLPRFCSLSAIGARDFDVACLDGRRRAGRRG